MSVNEAIEWLEHKSYDKLWKRKEIAAMLREAKKLIERIGTTGVERTDVIQRAGRWLKE